MQVSPARLAAFEILQRIETERAFSSILLPMVEERLATNDRGLCHELVLGTLRRQIYLDKVIEKFSGAKKLDIAVRIAIRLGIYQIIFLDKIPAYSAINESVNLVQMAKKTSAKGFANAILRRVSESVPSFNFSDDIERVSIQTSHPVWLIEKWISDFGSSEAEQIATANNSVPRIAFRFTRKAESLRQLAAYSPSDIAEGGYVVPSVNQALREMADSGEIYFQDEASQLVAQLASRNAKGRFLDVCAAPGGKTTQIAAEHDEAGRDRLVVAGDLHAFRVNLLRRTCEKQGVGFVNVVQYDAENALPFADESFDTVLVDAPCSGTGTIRHNPEIRYFLEAGDFSDLGNKQRRILQNASKLVRPGGRLVYSTCSIQGEENEAVSEWFMTGSEGFRQTTPNVPRRFLTDNGFARTFPHRDATDGFFVAEFERFDR